MPRLRAYRGSPPQTLVASNPMFANSGTIWIEFGFFWLLTANVLLGIFEGVLIACTWRIALRRSVSVMLAANFASSWAGAIAFTTIVDRARITIETLQAWTWISLAVLVALTLFVELPFVWSLVGPRKSNWLRAAATTLCVHAISYPLLLLLGQWWCGLPVALEWTVVPVAKVARPGTHVLFYVDANGPRIWRRDLAGGEEVVVTELVVPPRYFELFLQDEADGTSSLHVCLDGDSTATVVAGLRGLTADSAARPPSEAHHDASLTEESPWRFDREVLGLVCTGPGQRRLLSVLTPLTHRWRLSHVTQVADDLALVRVADETCLIKASTGEIAFVTRGRGATIAAVRP